MAMPMCACGMDYATVELEGKERVLACTQCASLLEMLTRLLGSRVRRRPVLGLVPGGAR